MGTRQLKFGEFKLCTSCKHRPENPKSIDDAPCVCWACSSSSTRDNPLPLWESKEAKAMHPYDAAFRQEDPKPSALDHQVAGNHYKTFKIQPIEFALVNGLNACETIALRYLVRKKGDKAKKLEDLDKAIHTIEIYKQMLKEGRIDV